MPEFTQQVAFDADETSLSPGWYPACLCLITEDAIPEGWQMGANGSTMMYRWHFAVWGKQQDMLSGKKPEHQTAVSSKTFSPGGKNPASKAFLWTEQLIGRRPNPGERINLDPLMPLPCRIKIARTKNDGTFILYARILDLEGWAEGHDLFTSEIKTYLMNLDWVKPPSQQQTQTRTAPTSQPNPNMVGWNKQPDPVVPPTPAKPTW